MQTPTAKTPLALSPREMAVVHAAAFTNARPWSEAEFGSLLDSRFVFAVGDRRSSALGRVIAGEAELLTIATRPDCWRQGLGRATLQAWVAEAVTRDATEGFLEVAEDNRAARALYVAHGFAETGRRPGYYARDDGPAVDAVLMTATLRKALGAE